MTAFELGNAAYWQGKDESANPFDPQSDDFLSWNDGWNEACEQDANHEGTEE